jgi:hypothetical protein
VHARVDDLPGDALPPSVRGVPRDDDVDNNVRPPTPATRTRATAAASASGTTATTTATTTTTTTAADAATARVDNDDETNDAAASGGARKKRKKQPEPTTQQVTLSHEEYREISLALVAHMRRSPAAEETGEVCIGVSVWMCDGTQQTIAALIEWRLTSLGASLVGADAVRQQAAITRSVVRRMIDRDHSLIVVDDEHGEDATLLQVHPNFVAE